MGTGPTGSRRAAERLRAHLPGLAEAHTAWLLVILGAGLAVRLLLGSHGVFQADAQTFRGWATRLVTTPLSDFYGNGTARPVDHLPGDLWILWGIAHLYRLISPDANFQSPGFLVLLKLVPGLADLGIGAVLYLIARHLAGPGVGLLAAALFVFNPAPVFVSAIWGQWDSVSALFMLVALWLVLRGSAEWALPALTYAVLIKPQLALLLPLLAIVWWRRYVQPGRRPERGPDLARRVRRLALATLASLGLFLALDLPFGVGLPPLPTRWTILERLDVAWNQERSVSANAFNLWGVLAHASGSRFIDDGRVFLLGVSYQHWGEALLALAVAIALVVVWRRPDAPAVLWATLTITLSLFMLPTRIHERYLMPAVVLAVLVAALAPGMRWLGVALSLTYLVNVSVVYHVFGRQTFGFGVSARPSDPVVLAMAATNLFLLLVVFGVGIALARRPVEEVDALAPAVGDADAPSAATAVGEAAV